jgi:hypothetical protein
MNCNEARNLFSPYLDGTVSGAEMRRLSQHLEQCPACAHEYTALRHTQRVLSTVGRRKTPPELALRLRVAASRAAAMAAQRPFESLVFRMRHLTDYMVPATAGLVSAILMFALLVGLYVAPTDLQAANDVPLSLYEPPELTSAPFGMDFNESSDAFIVEAYIDASGRVQDYRILSAPEGSQHLVPELKNMLLFTTFRPARSFGRPTSGRAVLTFSRVNVQG